MSRKLTEGQREAGWRQMKDGVISARRLAEWVNEYFGVQERNLSGFFRRSGEDGLELISPDERKGYVFFGSIQLDRDYEARMQRVRQHLDAGTKRVTRYFVDLENEVAGFAWSRK